MEMKESNGASEHPDGKDEISKLKSPPTCVKELFEGTVEPSINDLKELDIHEAATGNSAAEPTREESQLLREKMEGCGTYEGAKAAVPDAAATDVKKKKKKSGKSKSKKASEKPTGFEEYYVDPPVTPADFLEEQSLYDPAKTFAERIQTAVARFSSRRTFNEMRSRVFDKYMAYGGFLAGNKMFQGNVDPKSADLTSQEISELKNKYYLREDTLVTSTVDFDKVLQGFLSSYMPSCIDLYREPDINTAVGVLKNFLNYLVHHNVAPEYTSQIAAARRTCDMAQGQLLLCVLAASDLPGKFNEACSILYGGFYRDTFTHDREAMEKMGIDPGLTEEAAKRMFIGGLASQGSESMFDAYNKQVGGKSIHVKRTFRTFFEITELLFASSEVREMYNHTTMSGFSPIGKFKAQTWHCPGAPPEDLTEEEEEEFKLKPPHIEQFEFFVEDKVLEHLFAGMKMEAEVRETSFGLYYFESVTATLCSFYKFLPNESMMDWVPHRFLPYKKKQPPQQRMSDEGGDEQAVYAEHNKQEPLNQYEEHIRKQEELLGKYEEGEEIVVTT